MKLSTRDANAYFKKPDPNGAGILIFGADAMRVALKRQDVIKALVGPNGEDEMRLTRIWVPGDAQIIVTAGQLAARSTLRKLFESHPSAYAAGVYDNPPSRDEIEQHLRDASLDSVSRDAMNLIVALAAELSPGDLRQTIEKLGLYKSGDSAEVSVEDVEACAPQSNEASLDAVLNAAADLKANEIGPLLARLYAQGTQPVALCIATLRHFRQLHVAASDPGGAAAGIGRLKPPVFGPRRDRMVQPILHRTRHWSNECSFGWQCWAVAVNRPRSLKLWLIKKAS